MSEARLDAGRASKGLPADEGDQTTSFIRLEQLLQAHGFPFVPFVEKHIDSTIATLSVELQIARMTATILLVAQEIPR
jgi:hypothetical protein